MSDMPNIGMLKWQKDFVRCQLRVGGPNTDQTVGNYDDFWMNQSK